MKLLSQLKNLFKIRTREEAEYEYLANSVDLIDLERRQRQIQRGMAPFQQYL